MIRLIVLAMTALLIQTTYAAPLPNINGISVRLETIKCENGGYVALKTYIDTTMQAEAGQCNNVPDENACFEKLIKKHTQFSSSFFKGTAIENSKQFNMSIKTRRGSTLFYSIREGFHGDGANRSINLMFNRVGLTNDEYLIETGMLSDNGNSVPMIMIPVKRRFLPDQVYFFFNCQLNWAE